MYGTNYDLELLTFSHADASGASIRQTQASVMLVYPEQAEESPAEMDALGGNVGLSTPYIPEPEPIPPPENSPFQIKHEDSPMFVKGLRLMVCCYGSQSNAVSRCLKIVTETLIGGHTDLNVTLDLVNTA
jgi:hypothetical protein